ncbi:aspartate--tRNA ligase, partial [Peptostreptococcaceae bacterium OttesenSCG-928-C18]|nr:aspartate--tRNA ligase [Peptostreptococcaceae bacterium OttesenSCG-928-C18]
ANRQPEFTQVDIEMSFVDEDDVIEVNERLLKKVFKEVKGIDLEIPFKRMSYEEAMNKYGSDKPDLRFGFELHDITDIVKDSDFKVFSSCVKEGYSVRGINIGEYQGEFSRKKIDALQEYVKTYGAKGLAWIKVVAGEITSPILKFLKEEELSSIIGEFKVESDGLILIVADKDSVVFDSLGALRRHIARALGLLKSDEFAFTWVVDFPLFEYDEEEERLVAKHHPFTKPKEEDLELLETSPEKVRAKAYDIVVNGDELGGGSIRINNSDLQKRMFKALKLSDEEIENKFGFFVDALKYGTPPHGGLAYGLDRLMMLLCETENIKDVIAFPKTQSATDLLSEAPAEVDEKQLKEIHIKLDK